MPIRLRLARHGQSHTPVYHLVAINATKRRDAMPIEKLGEYDPLPRTPKDYKLPVSHQVFGARTKAVPKEKRIEWNVERINHWLSVGAQPTPSVVRLLERGGILTGNHKWQHKWSNFTTEQALPKDHLPRSRPRRAEEAAPTPEAAPKAAPKA